MVNTSSKERKRLFTCLESITMFFPFFFFFFNDTATTEIYTLSLHDALPISRKPEKLPPVACAPHSITWPATTAPASVSWSPGVHPHHQAAAPLAREASATRPVTTTSAPASSAAAIPKPQR